MVGNYRLEEIPFEWDRFNFTKSRGMIYVRRYEGDFVWVYISDNYSNGILISKNGEWGMLDRKVVWRNDRLGFYDRLGNKP